jgi:hypothetical protein
MNLNPADIVVYATDFFKTLIPIIFAAIIIKKIH